MKRCQRTPCFPRDDTLISEISKALDSCSGLSSVKDTGDMRAWFQSMRWAPLRLTIRLEHGSFSSFSRLQNRNDTGSQTTATDEAFLGHSIHRERKQNITRSIMSGTFAVLDHLEILRPAQVLNGARYSEDPGIVLALADKARGRLRRIPTIH